MRKRRAVRKAPPVGLPNCLSTAVIHVFTLEGDAGVEGLTLQIENDRAFEGSPNVYLRWDYVARTLTLFVEDANGRRKIDQWQTKEPDPVVVPLRRRA